VKGEAARQKLARGWARYDSINLALVPHKRVRTAAGGYDQAAQTPRPPQIWGVATGIKSTTTTQDGTVVSLAAVLVGPVGAIVEVGDRFEHNGFAMEVLNVRKQVDGVYAEAIRHG